ncbi:MAG: Fumarate hydratase class II [Candidatus Heimdallarchaeota archaeon LC_2]|nr:MAG: Fumarate hydratase class II [Candidatus Heimdallarchaeota archaeon LC_2]
MSSQEIRIENDTMGEVEVPSNAIWGAQTQRSIQNFQISTRRFPKSFIIALTQVKRACAIANGELGVIERDIAEVITKAANEIINDGLHLNQFPLDIYQTGSGTQTNMNANEVLSNRAIQIMGGQIGSKTPVHPNDHVNKGQSSNDVIPTAMHLSALTEITKTLEPALEGLIISLRSKQNEFINIVKIGRTHLQDAVPLTLGQEFSAYVFQLETVKSHIKEASRYLEQLAIGGTAVGTGLNAHRDLDKKVCSILSNDTGLNFRSDGNKFALIASKDALVGVSGALKTLAITLIKIANDIRWLSSGPRCGLGEISLPENEPGSSIMPGKVNPTQNEMLIQVGAQVIGNDVAVSMGGSWGVLELNLMKPMIISNVLESIELLANGMNSFSINCISGIKANETRINNLVSQSLMLVTALTKDIGYDKAAYIAKKAFKEGKTIRETVLNEGLIPESEIDKKLDLTKMVHLDRM